MISPDKLGRQESSGSGHVTPPDAEAWLPLTPSQRAIWIACETFPEQPAYNVAFTARITARFDPETFKEALDHLVARHPILSARFELRKGEPMQKPQPLAEMPVTVREVGDLSGETIRTMIDEMVHKPFDLVAGPPFRAHVLRRGQRDHLLLFVVHHLVADFATMIVLLEDLRSFYEPGLPISRALPVRTASFADYARGLREWLGTAAAEQQRVFWQHAIAGSSARLSLPFDREPNASGRLLGGAIPVPVNPLLNAAVKRLIATLGGSQFSAFLALYQLLLARLSGQTDFLVGVPVSLRRRREHRCTVGYLVNVLPLRAQIDERETVSSLLRQTWRRLRVALRYREYPISLPSGYLTTGRSEGFMVMLVEQRSANAELGSAPAFSMGLGGERLEIGVLAAESIDLELRTAQCALTLVLGGEIPHLKLLIQYDRAVFDRTTVQRLGRHLLTLLSDAAERPEAALAGLASITPAERQQLLVEAQDTFLASPVERLHERVISALERWADSVAVVSTAQHVTYGELSRRALGLSARLQMQQIGPGSIVAVWAEPAATMVVAVLGVLCAGGAVLPLDPSLPDERLAWMIHDTRAAMVIAPQGLSRSGVLRPIDCPVWEMTPEGDDGSRPSPPSRGGGDPLAFVFYTSGSTGSPKGVMVSHEALCNRLRWMQRAYGLGRDDRVIQKASWAFDVSVWELFWPLIEGATLMLASPAQRSDPTLLSRLLAAERITTIHFVPSLLELFLREPRAADQCLALSRIFASGEALTTSLAQRVRERLAAPLHNLYGPTEAAIDVTAWRCRADLHGATVPIGRPIDNVCVYLADSRLRPVALGGVGEVVIGGRGLARGYLGRPALTARRFVPDPFTLTAGERLYRSGDLARRLVSGEIEFLGRIDFQVKIHGYRVELGEVERVLERHPAIATAVALAHEGRLIAYVVPNSSTTPSGSELELFLRQQLPAPLVPTAILPLERLPLTPNGKLDRAALPSPAIPARPRPKQPPRDPKEAVLTKIWEEVLDCGPVGVDDRFFELGGDSIRSIQVRAAARREGLQLPAELFYHQTLAELAALAVFGPELDPGVALPARVLPAIDPTGFGAGVVEVFPLSSLQESLVFHSELSPDYEVYVMSLEVRGPWRSELFARALVALAQRHPMLRTTFDLTSFAEPVQLVWREVSLPLRICDLRVLMASDAQQVLDAFLRREVDHRFDWRHAPLWRLVIHRISSETFQLTLSQPFLDGWSVALFAEELLRGYLAALQGGDALPPPIHTSYRDFVAHERLTLASESQRRFWSRELDALPRPCLPPRWGMPSQRADALHARHVLRVGDDVVAGLRQLSRLAAVPLRSVLLAVHLRLLSLLAGRRELVTGMISHSRPESEGGDRVLGLFLNTVPFRFRLPVGSWVELAQGVYAKECELSPYRQYPFAHLQAEHGRVAMIDTAFNFTRFHPYDGLRRLSGLQVLSERIPSDQTYFPFTVYFDERVDGGLRIALDFDGRRLDRAQVLAMARQLEHLLGAMATRPGADHPAEILLPPVEMHQLLIEPDSRWRPAARRSVLEKIHEQIRIRPDAVALVDGVLHFSYHGLDQRRQKAAQRLRELGMGPEKICGLSMSRSWSQVVAMLGILETGAAFLPISPDDPLERRRRLAARAPVGHVLSQAEELEPETSMSEDVLTLESRNPRSCVSAFCPEALAYVMPTSGSTGEPKAVQISRAALDGFLNAIAEPLGLGPDAALLAATPLSFDISLLELLLPLTTGGRLVLAPADAPFDPARLGAALDVHRADVFQATPSVWRALVETGWTARTSLLALCGGAELTRDLAERLLAQPMRSCNLYGPTEATIWSTLAVIRDPEPAIGRPLANTRVYVLDGWLSPLPRGSAGELYLGGAGLARGYAADPVTTAERFLPDPFSPIGGARMYRTGDRVLMRPEGSLLFLGRLDTQLKVRGHRIEPAEVEAALRRSPAVAESVVAALPDPRAEGEARLVGYLVLQPGTPPGDLAEIRQTAAALLPSSMVPQDLVVLDRLPLNRHGKVDRRALPDPGAERTALRAQPVPPRDALEHRLAAIWRSVLALEEVGIDDGFFELGGSSLLLLRLHRRLRVEIAPELALTELFEIPTIRALAVRLSTTTPPRAPLASIHEQAAMRRARLTALRAQRLEGRM